MTYQPLNKIDVRGIDKAELLMELVNAAKVEKNYSKEPITIDIAEEALKKGSHIVGVAGRMLNVKINGMILDAHEYNSINREMGDNLAQNAVQKLRERLAENKGSKQSQCLKI